VHMAASLEWRPTTASGMAADHARTKFVNIDGDCGTAPCAKMLCAARRLVLFERGLAEDLECPWGWRLVGKIVETHEDCSFFRNIYSMNMLLPSSNQQLWCEEFLTRNTFLCIVSHSMLNPRASSMRTDWDRTAVQWSLDAGWWFQICPGMMIPNDIKWIQVIWFFGCSVQPPTSYYKWPSYAQLLQFCANFATWCTCKV
jgi:hypothetical protein